MSYDERGVGGYCVRGGGCHNGGGGVVVKEVFMNETRRIRCTIYQQNIGGGYIADDVAHARCDTNGHLHLLIGRIG